MIITIDVRMDVAMDVTPLFLTCDPRVRRYSAESIPLLWSISVREVKETIKHVNHSERYRFSGFTCPRSRINLRSAMTLCLNSSGSRRSRAEEILEHVFTPLSWKNDTCDFHKNIAWEIRTDKFRTSMFFFWLTKCRRDCCAETCDVGRTEEHE